MFAVRIWIKTILINIVLIALGLIYMKEIEGFLFAFVLLIAAVLFTAPLLIIITQAVRIARRIPYAWQARFAWLSFMLLLIGITFYVLIGLAIDASVFNIQDLGLFLLATIASILLAAQLSKKSFQALNT